MNRFISNSLSVALLSGLLCGCNWNDAEYGSSVSLSSPGVAMDSYETESEIRLTANCPWSSAVDFSSGEEWCELNPSTGMGSATVKILLAPNPHAENRTATVTFRAQDELGQKISYTITQRGTAYYFDFDGSVTDGLFEVAQQGGPVCFTFHAGSEWTAAKEEGDNDWLTLRTGAGDKGDVTFEMDVDNHTGVRPRSTFVTFTSRENPRNTATVTIRQLVTLPAATASVTNADLLQVDWTQVANATSYEVVVKKSEDKSVIGTIAEISPSVCTADLLAGIDFGTYVGGIAVEVKSYFDNDPELYSYSEPVTAHSHFATESGNGTPDQEYVIACARHLQNVSAAKTACYRQTADIDFAGVADFKSIGDSNSPFTGSYSAAAAAGNYKIKNLHLAATGTTCSGLFGHVERGGVVTRLTLEKCSLSMGSLNKTDRKNGHALVVGINGGEVSHIDLVDCTVEGSVAADNRFLIGGVVGTNYKGQVSYCTATGGKMTVSGKSTAGAIVGMSGRKGYDGQWAQSTVTVTYCSNISMEIDGSGQPADDGPSNVGAIGGVVGGNEGVIQYCANKAYVHGSHYSGGILGTTSYDRTVNFAGGNMLVSRCCNTGTVEGRWAGGIVSALVQASDALRAQTIVSECVNTGRISGNYPGAASGSKNHVGGIVARNYGTIENCYNTGTVDGHGNSNTGGICGDYYKKACVLSSCYNAGQIIGGIATATGAVAGLIAASGSTLDAVYLDTTCASAVGTATAGNLTGSLPAGVDDAAMKNPATFGGWDSAVWDIVPGSYPTLKNVRIE